MECAGVAVWTLATNDADAGQSVQVYAQDAMSMRIAAKVECQIDPTLVSTLRVLFTAFFPAVHLRSQCPRWCQSAAFNSMAPQHRDWRITGQPDHGYFSLLSNGSSMASNSLAHPATWLVPSTPAPQVDLNAI